MNHSQWLMNDAANAMGWALVHSVWQGAAAAAVFAVILRLLSHASSALRYVLAYCGLLSIVIGFALTAWLYWPQESAVIAARPLPLALPPQPIEPAVVEVSPIAIEPAWTLERTLPWVVAIWLIGVIILSLWQFGGWMLLGRYRRTAEPANELWQGRLRDLAHTIGVKRVAMRITQRLDVPIVIGMFRPIILMPAAVLANLPLQQIEGILAHELAHIRRHDYLINLIQSAIETIFFYHPAVWWISKQIRKEREFCCDEVAARVCGDRATYARALAALEESRAIRLAPAAGGGGRGELIERIRRILGQRAASKTGRQSRSWIMAGLVVIACVAIGTWSRRLAAQTPSTTQASAAPATSPSGPGPILPEDFVVRKGDYRIVANDLLQVSIIDLVGPGIKTTKETRVTESGYISMPLIQQVKAAGLTAVQLETAISQAYRDKALIRDAVVSVVVLEAHGRLFSVLGAVGQPGQFAIVDPDFRLFNALVLARGTTGNGDVRVIRPTDDPTRPRTIEIPGAAVAARDPKVNIVIQGGDTVLVVQSENPAQLPPVTAPASQPAADEPQAAGQDAELTRLLAENVAAQEAAWTALEQRAGAGEALTPAFVQVQLDTAKRICDARIAAATDQAGKIAAAEEYLQRCVRFAEMLIRRQGQDVTSLQISQATSMVADAKMRLAGLRADRGNYGEYYLAGEVRRSGVYALNARGVTLRQAIIAAGGPDGAETYVTLIRRTGTENSYVLRNAPLNDILNGRAADVMLKVDDQIMVSDRANLNRPATLPAIRTE